MVTAVTITITMVTTVTILYRETTYVAGWGITKTKLIHGSKIQVKVHPDQRQTRTLLSQVKGIPDVARHAPVTVTECSDTDNFPYPEVFPQYDTDDRSQHQ